MRRITTPWWSVERADIREQRDEECSYRFEAATKEDARWLASQGGEVWALPALNRVLKHGANAAVETAKYRERPPLTGFSTVLVCPVASGCIHARLRLHYRNCTATGAPTKQD